MSDTGPDRRNDRQIGQLIQAAGRGPKPSAEAREKIYAAVHAEWRRNVGVAPRRSAALEPARQRAADSRRPIWRRPSLAFAATLVVVAVAVVGYTLRAPEMAPAADIGAVVKVVGLAGLIGPEGGRAVPLSGPTEILNSGQVLVTGNNGGVAIDVDSGVTLRADVNTELLLAAADRFELRAGRIYLDTGADAGGSPNLLVDTPMGSVQHTGTQYEVRVAGMEVRIRVREGSIEFRDDSRDLTGNMGEEILLGATGVETRATIAPHDAEWAWTESLAAAPKANEYELSDVLLWVTRQTGRRLRYEDTAAQAAVTGVTLHGIGGLNPQETLGVLESTTELRYRFEDDSLIVY